jgi:hypothetical protein
MFVTFHRVSTCNVARQFMCAAHFKAIFLNHAEAKYCPNCDQTRLISAKPVFP